MRYAWEPRFLADEDVGGLARRALPFLLPRIRRQDLVASTRPDLFVANSTHVAARIDKYYRRDALVVHPPVEIERYRAVERRPGDYYLVLGRVVPYKRVDLAVAACARLDRRVLVAGDGRAMPLARAAAGPGAEFLGRVPDEQLPDLLAGARALLFCGEEDFGIVPVEAQAAGVPLIAYGVGGVRDSVADGETGILFEEQTVESVADAILAFEERTFEEARIRAQAEQFGPERFLDRFASVVAEHAHPSPVNR
jgi:glycosyltransferase involved in cell wall biosynthesis